MEKGGAPGESRTPDLLVFRNSSFFHLAGRATHSVGSWGCDLDAGTPGRANHGSTAAKKEPSLIELVQKLGQVIPVMEQLPPLLLDFEIELAHGG